MSVRLCPTATVVLGLTALLLASVALGRAETGSPARIKFDQGELDEDEKISPAVEAKVARVLRRNRRLLGAHPIDFCRRMPPDERKGCLATVEQIEAVEIGDIVKVRENSDLSDGGREWPNAAAVSGFRRLRLEVPLHKGERTTGHEVSMVQFDSRRGDTTETCVFPLEHWSWSEMDRPERFAQAPVGVCGERAQTVAAYLLEHVPDAAPEVLRFLSEPEARAWQSRDPERIKWDSPYTSGHPYAKYFMLDSLRWWRGGRPNARHEGYAWAVRIARLPLRRILELEGQGDLFLDVFEDGAQIELTNVTQAGLLALLAENPAVLIDVSTPDDTVPRFEPLPN